MVEYIHSFVSPYSFVMGVFWFSAFILLGLLMRKLKFPIKFSVVPLLLVLILSVFRMFVAVEVPGSTVVFSDTVYPPVVNFFRIELLPYHVFGFPINIINAFVILWAIGAIFLIIRYAREYVGRFPGLLRWYEKLPRDEHAESLLSEIIGTDKHFRVYRSGAFSTPLAAAFKPYIILPKVDFSDDELRVMLLHEWKHIQDKDYLTNIIVHLICFVFWWNPVVYILKRNFKFAMELKCDGFAVSNKKEFRHWLNGLAVLDDLKKSKADKRMNFAGGNALVGSGAELLDRLKVIAIRSKSRGKRMLTNVCYSVAIVALFIMSYTFIVLPAAWESPYETVTAEDFIGDYWEPGDVLRVEESYIIDNEDGTFSLYIDGHFVMYIDNTNEMFSWFTIRTSELN